LDFLKAVLRFRVNPLKARQLTDISQTFRIDHRVYKKKHGKFSHTCREMFLHWMDLALMTGQIKLGIQPVNIGNPLCLLPLLLLKI